MRPPPPVCGRIKGAPRAVRQNERRREEKRAPHARHPCSTAAARTTRDARARHHRPAAAAVRRFGFGGAAASWCIKGKSPRSSSRRTTKITLPSLPFCAANHHPSRGGPARVGTTQSVFDQGFCKLPLHLIVLGIAIQIFGIVKNGRPAVIVSSDAPLEGDSCDIVVHWNWWEARQNSAPSRGTNPPNGGLFHATAATNPICAGAGSGE